MQYRSTFSLIHRTTPSLVYTQSTRKQTEKKLEKKSNKKTTPIKIHHLRYLIQSPYRGNSSLHFSRTQGQDTPCRSSPAGDCPWPLALSTLSERWAIHIRPRPQDETNRLVHRCDFRRLSPAHPPTPSHKPRTHSHTHTPSHLTRRPGRLSNSVSWVSERDREREIISATCALLTLIWFEDMQDTSEKVLTA